MTLDIILDALSLYQQRATYGAVAGLLGRPARGLMGHRPKDRRHSWVVNKSSGLPTGYSDYSVDPALRKRDRVLETPEELQVWLKNPS